VSDILCAEDGAQFGATIQRTEDGPQASYLVTLDVGNTTKTERDLRQFANDAEARRWLDGEAARRGFTQYPVELI
jgi:hypothetical protein